MSSITAVAQAFFDACETGKGWQACSAYCTPDATFAAQAEPLLEVKTLAQYTEWMKAILAVLPDGHYEVKSFATDTARNNVTAYAVFHGTHTGEGGPVPPTGRKISTDYVYAMEFEGDKIAHMTKVWHAGLAMKAAGWVPDQAAEEANKAAVQRWVQAVNDGVLEVLDELAAADYVYRGSGFEMRGLSELKAFLRDFRAAFPDMKVIIERIMCDADVVALHYRMTGTQRLDFFGIPARGGRLDMSSMSLARLRDGKIAEHWELVDELAMRRQLAGEVAEV